MNYALILSGGIGSRMGGDIPKQFIEVEGQPIISYSIKTFAECTIIERIIIVVADEWKDFIISLVAKLNVQMPVFYASPGETRQYSILNGLIECRKQGASRNDYVIIHDAARPLVSDALIRACLEGCKDADGVLPVIPVKDTLYLSRDSQTITSLLNRNEIFAGQAPEAFLFGKYLALHENMSHDEIMKINGSTEIAYKGGLSVKMIKGDEMNFKITTPEDLYNFENIVKNAR